MCLYKCLYTDVNRSFIHNHPKQANKNRNHPSDGENVDNVWYIMAHKNNETELPSEKSIVLIEID